MRAMADVGSSNPNPRNAQKKTKKKKNTEKRKNTNSEDQGDNSLLQKEVSSFASSIGLAPSLSSSLPDSGFDDSDFRKIGPLKPVKSSKSENQAVSPSEAPKKSKAGKRGEKRKDGISKNQPSRYQENPDNSFKSKNLQKKVRKYINGEDQVFGSENGEGRNVKHKKLGSDSQSKNKSSSNFKTMPGTKSSEVHRDASTKTVKEKLPLMGASLLSQYWYDDLAKLEPQVLGSVSGKKVSEMGGDQWSALVQKKTEVAKQLMEQYSQDYELTRAKSSDMRMAAAAQRSGTAADKVAAFTVLIQDNPIANLRSLDALLAMVMSKVGKRHALTGFDALRELFLVSLLPDRKLKYLFQHPLNCISESKDGFFLLLLWYWEDCLKNRYERFIAALEEASKDTLYVLKKKSLKTLYKLLESKPEQERRLLSAVVNKLGDPEARVASDASFFLTCLLSTHPNMKLVVIEEVDFFLFRPHVGLRAKCHAINFLNQIVLHSKGDGPKVAKRLVDIYFALFKVLTSEVGGGEKAVRGKKTVQKQVAKAAHKKENEGSSLLPAVEIDCRLLSALLIGVNRAFPFVSSEEADAVIEHQTPVLFKLAHSKNFNIGVQALMLLFQILSKNQAVSDRFYRALYSNLLVPTIMKSTSSERFLALLLQAMKSDVNVKRVAAFSKRLLQVALHQPPQYACGCLVLLSEVLKARPLLWNMLLQNESGDDGLEHFDDVIEDPEDMAGVSPITRVTTSTDVVSNGHNAVDISRVSDSEESEIPDSNLSDDETSGSEGEEGFFRSEARAVKSLPSMGEHDTKPAHEKGHGQVSNLKSVMPGGYDVKHREPSFCRADCTSWWELTALALHVHPSVATMARTLLSGAVVVYNGEPIRDLSLSAFLDKFIEKKPKSSWRSGGTWHGGSEIAPARKLDLNKHFVGSEILSLAEEEVAPEDIVFHRFYVNKKSSSKRRKKKKQTEDEAAEELIGLDKDQDDFDEADQSDNEEIDELLATSAGMVVESDGEYDYDKLDEIIDDDDELLADGSDDEADISAGLSEDSDEDNLYDADANLEGGSVHINEGTENRKKRKTSTARSAAFSGGDDAAADELDLDAVNVGKTSGKRKHPRTGGKKSGASPFASLEEYDHLLNDDEGEVRKLKPHKRKRSS
ncbi:protein SLOW WALKER 2 [Nymphaea colorata]|nr:protein SLOW WALKER 2 [Nymphaea colorata]